MSALNWTDVMMESESQLHIIKHFSFIDDSYKTKLSKEGNLSTDEIEKLLLIPCSKFNPTFTSNPLHLISWLSENTPKSSVRFKNGKCEISYIVKKSLFPDGIGYDNLIPISCLNQNELKIIKSEKREDFTILSIQKEIKKPTWQINCIIVNIGCHKILKTIYPGEMAPPFPDNTYQSEKEYEKNIAFWSKYAFIVSTSNKLSHAKIEFPAS